MSRYIPDTQEQQKDMLVEAGFRSMDELFSDIPENVKLNRSLNLPAALSEPELVRHMKAISSRNSSLDEFVSFLGAGSYDHYIPSVVGHILSRQEFYTAYTPYQPEISQGTLQAIFEYQSMICILTGMDVSNASMYDGASALAEAASMACQSVRRSEILVASTVHPESRRVLDTYCRFKGIKTVEFGYKDGKADLACLEGKLNENTAAVVMQYPNFFGVIEEIDKAAELAHLNKSLLVTSVDPIALGILKSPGDLGADIAVGEGQSLGNAISFGGPYLGFMAAKKELMRKMPGRIVGETIDNNGRRGYVLTLQAREQHIRREKATSNICSNEALNALAATVYLTVTGKEGLKKTAELCLHKAHYLYDRLTNNGLFQPCFNSPFFKEFAVKSSIPIKELNQLLLADRIIGGYDLGRDYSELSGCVLLAVTEKRTAREMDEFTEIAGKAGLMKV
jgi:glycine dehydrogenase subunit 1